VGPCIPIAPAQVLSALQARFTRACERCTIGVPILLTPTSPTRIQFLDFEPRPVAPPH
jgi:hypothetical protein